MAKFKEKKTDTLQLLDFCWAKLQAVQSTLFTYVRWPRLSAYPFMKLLSRFIPESVSHGGGGVVAAEGLL